LECLPVTQEVAGSSPVRTAIFIVNETIMFSFFLCFLLNAGSLVSNQAFFYIVKVLDIET
ncbi:MULTISPECIES: hypothetical protein, partial [Bacillus]|uniref:hypothetical protein n=1 Tax=Bacillus TaxID=1386 RepID=UPI0006A5C29A